MLKKYFLSTLVLFGALMPLGATNESSDEKRRKSPSVFECAGFGAALGAAWWVLFGLEESPKPPVEKPQLDLRAERLGYKVTEVFGDGTSDRYAAYLSVDLLNQNYRVYLNNQRQQIERLFDEVEVFVQDRSLSWQERKTNTEKVRRLREEFKGECAASNYVISRQLSDIGASAVRPRYYVNQFLTIISAAAVK